MGAYKKICLTVNERRSPDLRLRWRRLHRSMKSGIPLGSAPIALGSLLSFAFRNRLYARYRVCELSYDSWKRSRADRTAAGSQMDEGATRDLQRCGSTKGLNAASRSSRDRCRFLLASDPLGRHRWWPSPAPQRRRPAGLAAAAPLQALPTLALNTWPPIPGRQHPARRHAGAQGSLRVGRVELARAIGLPVRRGCASDPR
jgi:hypothetical protein